MKELHADDNGDNLPLRKVNMQAASVGGGSGGGRLNRIDESEPMSRPSPISLRRHSDPDDLYEACVSVFMVQFLRVCFSFKSKVSARV